MSSPTLVTVLIVVLVVTGATLHQRPLTSSGRGSAGRLSIHAAIAAVEADVEEGDIRRRVRERSTTKDTAFVRSNDGVPPPRDA